MIPRRLVMPLALALAAMLVAGPALAVGDPLLGQWRYPDGTVMEFAAGGRLTIKGKPEAPSNTMRYFVEDDSTLVLVREDEDNTMTMGFRVSPDGKRLTLFAQENRRGGQPEVLERVR